MKIIFLLSFILSSISAKSQADPLIAIFAARVFGSAFEKEGLPLYSVFDAKTFTKQDKKRLSNQYKILTKEIRKTPDNPDLYLARGYVLDTLGVHDKVFNDFGKAYDLGDHSRKVLMALGIINFRAGSKSSAIIYFKRIIEHDSLDAEAYLYSGITMLYYPKKFQSISSRCKEAMPYFKKSLKIRPEYKEALILLGYCYHLLENKSEAIAQYEKAITVSPKSFSPYILLCRIYLKDKDFSNACLSLKRAKKHDIIIPENYYKNACR